MFPPSIIQIIELNNKNSSITNMKKIWISIQFLTLLILFTACQVIGGNFIGDSAQPMGSKNILLEDGFSNPSSGWDRQNSDDVITDYEDGRYHIQVNRPDYNVFANPYRTFTDVRVEVEAVLVSGNTDNKFGAICRFADANNFYAGLISSDGFYGIFKVKGGEYELLGMASMGVSPAIRTGFETNLIRLDCIGSRLELYVNGVQLYSRQDTEFTGGDVGLLAGAYRRAGTHIAFDNFKVYKP